MESGRPSVWRLVIFFAALALAAGAFGALALPRLAVDASPARWQLAAAELEAAAPKPHRCRHDERPPVRAFDYAR